MVEAAPPYVPKEPLTEPPAEPKRETPDLQAMVDKLLAENDDLRRAIETPLKTPLVIAGIAALLIGAVLFLPRKAR